jgi:hypothetical protein
MINLPDLADKLNQYGLLQKSFMDMSKPEIQLLVTAVFSCPDDTLPVEGWEDPRIDEKGDLHITFNSHPKYHWWNPDGQSVLATLIELNAPWEVAKKYMENRGNSHMTEADYMNRLIPF